MFAGKVVLITGASSGIGANTALHFAEEGARLSLTGRNTANLEEVGKQCKEKGGLEPVLISADMTVDSDVKNILETTINAYGRLDVLVNNAGVMLLGPLGAANNLEQYDRMFATNVRSVYLLTNLAVPYLVESKGNIVNISSVAALRTCANFAAYSMTKAALDHFTRCAALELAPKQVRVNSVNPGMVETNLQKNAGLSDEEVAQFTEVGRKAHPIGRVGEPADVARAILFLADERASFITGEIMVVDGGIAIAGPM